MHAPTTFDTRIPEGLPAADPRQLTLFEPTARRFRRPGAVATVVLLKAFREFDAGRGIDIVQVALAQIYSKNQKVC